MLSLGPGWSDTPVAEADIGTATSAQQTCVRTLLASLQIRIDAITDFSKVNTALGWLWDFFVATGRVPFVVPDSETARMYNQTTLECFAEFMRLSGSKQRGNIGKVLKSDTISASVSTVRLLASKIARREIVSSELNTVLPVMFKEMRRADGPRGERRLSRGLRARHLRTLAAMGYDRSSRRGMMKWAVALSGHNMMLHGGEVGHTGKAAFDPLRGIVWDSITWMDPCADSEWLPWLTFSIVGIKDANFRHQRCIMPIRRRSATAALGDDPLCTFDAVRIVWLSRIGEVDTAEMRAITPFFTGDDDHSAWTTANSKSLGVELGGLVGIPAHEIGGKFARIGGACDFREVMGESGIIIIKQRGRWHSDIALVYQRALAETHLAASASVGSAHLVELESVCIGWIQPASFR
jgi:hypothetical protein